MSIDYLDDLEAQITNGKTYYACPGPNANEWFISESREDLAAKAQRTANARNYDVNLYKLVNKMDTVTGDGYLVVRKILEPGPRGEPHFAWLVCDTREAADMLRDVSQGPSPYFGAVVQASFKPAS